MSDLGDKIRRNIVSAIADYEMLEDGDKVMVAVSGGKDSSIMLLQLEEIRRRAKINFTIAPVILDQKQPGFNADSYQAWFKERGFDLVILGHDTYSTVVEKTEEGKSFCRLCSRFRRGILYNYAHENGFTKIALGHHRDDLNETMLMNMFFIGQLGSMPPKLFSDDGRNTVIRPLCYIPESELIQYSKELAFPIIPCNLCGTQENMKRSQVKNLLSNLEKQYPGLGASMLTAQKNIKPSQLLDQQLWNFSEPEIPLAESI